MSQLNIRNLTLPNQATYLSHVLSHKDRYLPPLPVCFPVAKSLPQQGGSKICMSHSG
jgi:hypothetical protein